MKASRLLQGTSYEPDKVAFLGRAFDEAWKSIEPNYRLSPVLIEAARLKLAEGIIQHAPNFWDDIEALKKVAIRQMGSPPVR